MFKYIISILLVLSVAMLSCLDDELRMASIYKPDISKTVEPQKPENSLELVDDYGAFEYSTIDLISESFENRVEDTSEIEDTDEDKELSTNTLNKQATSKKFVSSEKNPSALDNNSQENYNYRRVKSTKQSPELFQYKSSVLMRLSAGYTNTKIESVDSINPVESDELLSLDSSEKTDDEATLNNDDELLTDDDLIKILDDAPEINTEPLDIEKPFNFNLQQQKTVSVSSVDANGEIIAHARFTIENSSGNIIKEGSTDKQGKYSTQLKQFNNNPIYVRFHTIGMNPERVLINQEEEL